MWAQLIKVRVRPGRDAGLHDLLDRLHEAEQPDSGLLRTTALRDQKDRSAVYLLVVFASEEKARAREQDPRREAGLAAVRAIMAEMFDGPPEFVDLDVLRDVTP